MAAAATATSDRVCRGCRSGTTDHDSDGSTACRACAPGTFVAAESQGSCVNFQCPPGTRDHDGDPATPCLACGADTFQPASGATSCLVRGRRSVRRGVRAQLTRAAGSRSRRRCAGRVVAFLQPRRRPAACGQLSRQHIPRSSRTAWPSHAPAAPQLGPPRP